MTITIKAKPLEVNVEVPGYGTFYVKQMGAGVEADIKNRLAEASASMDALREKYDALFKKEGELIKAKDEAGLKELKATDEYKQATQEQRECSKALDAVVNYSNECHLKLWRSDDPEAMKKFLNDFSAQQIMSFHAQVMAELRNA